MESYPSLFVFEKDTPEDDLRKIGFSKDCKHRNHEIYLGLLVSIGGKTISFNIFEGNI